MRIASRHMPKFAPKPMSPAAWVLIASLFAALTYVAVSAPKAIAAGFAVLLLLYLWARNADKQVQASLRKLAAGREGQTLCEFALDFGAREVDTWIIRAVYEQLQRQLTHMHQALPVRASDRLKEDLHLDDDDIDIDLVQEVEERISRSLDHTRTNPYFGHVVTVRDLVLFFQAQPKHGRAVGVLPSPPAKLER